MTATYNPAEVERLVREAVRRACLAVERTAATAVRIEQLDAIVDRAVQESLAAMADQLEAARAEIDRLRAAGHRAVDDWSNERLADRAELTRLRSELDTTTSARSLAEARTDRLDASEGGPGWRSGIEASIRRLEAQQRKPRDLWHAAYFAAIDEALVHLRAMLERGAERSVTPLDG